MNLPNLVIKKGVCGGYKIVVGEDLPQKIGELVNDREIVLANNIESLEEAEKIFNELIKEHTMNTNKIKNILGLFNKYRVVLVKEDAVAKFVSTSEVIGKADNEVLYLQCEDDDDNDYCVKFDENGLNNADIEDGHLIMEDIEGDSIRIEFQWISKHDLVIEEID